MISISSLRIASTHGVYHPTTEINQSNMDIDEPFVACDFRCSDNAKMKWVDAVQSVLKSTENKIAVCLTRMNASRLHDVSVHETFIYKLSETVGT